MGGHDVNLPGNKYSGYVSGAKARKDNDMYAAKSWTEVSANTKESLFSFFGVKRDLPTLLSQMARDNNIRFSDKQKAMIEKIVNSDGKAEVSMAELATILSLADAQKNEDGSVSYDNNLRNLKTGNSGLDDATEEDIIKILKLHGQNVDTINLDFKGKTNENKGLEIESIFKSNKENFDKNA